MRRRNRKSSPTWFATSPCTSRPQIRSLSAKENVSPDALEHERKIQRERALKEGKPEKMVDKIVEGRLSKFYEEVCLLEQPFIKENSITVGELIKSKAAKLGADQYRGFRPL